MALTADQITDITRGTVDLYRTAEQAIAAQVTRYLRADLDIPDWAASRMGALATLRSTVQRVLEIVERDGTESIRESLATAYRSGQAEATADIPARLLPRDPDAVRASAVIATELPRAGVVENLAAALVDDVGKRHSNVLRNVLDTYRQVVTQATAASVAGGITRRDAAQLAYARLVDQGLVSFVDRRGRRWRLSSYVEMALRTVTQRAAVQGQTDRQTRLGLPYVMVSNETQECARCRPYEGKVLRVAPGPIGTGTETNPATGERVRVTVVATLDQARAEGFQHPNCRHSVRAFLPGVTRLPDPPTADPEGDAARQRQRAIERAIRRWKEREAAALTPAGKKAARDRVTMWQGQMRDHLAANPRLKRLPYREQIGAGNIPPARPRLPRPPSIPAPAELPERISATLTPPPAPRDPLGGRDLADFTDDEVFDLFVQVTSVDDLAQVDETLMTRLTAEMERREHAAATPPAAVDDGWLNAGSSDRFDTWDDIDPADPTPEQRRLDELLAQGWDYMEAWAEAYGEDVDKLRRQEAASALDRRAGESIDQAARRAYDEWVHVRYLEAEQATRGSMLSREGAAAGIDPRTLFGGPISRARRYASEELLRWWTRNDRLTFEQFRAQLLGRDSDIQAARRARGQSNGEDFI